MIWTVWLYDIQGICWPTERPKLRRICCMEFIHFGDTELESCSRMSIDPEVMDSFKSLQMYLRRWGHCLICYILHLYSGQIQPRHQLSWLNVIKFTWVISHIFDLTQLFSLEDFLSCRLYVLPPHPPHMCVLNHTHTHTYTRCTHMCRVEWWYKISWFKILDFGFEMAACVTKGVIHQH